MFKLMDNEIVLSSVAQCKQGGIKGCYVYINGERNVHEKQSQVLCTHGVVLYLFKYSK